MTLMGTLIPGCYITYAMLGMLAGQPSGGVGISIGIGAGFVAGGLAHYALEKTVCSDEWEARRKSQSQVVRALAHLVTGGWMIVFVLLASPLMTIFAMRFIVQQMAG